MHQIFGFTIAEWAGIATIATSVIIAIYHTVVKPLKGSLQRLANAIEKMGIESKEVHEKMDARIDHHENMLTKHETEIGFLYQINGLKRKGYSNDDKD